MKTYIWKDNEVLIVDYQVFAGDARELKAEMCPVVDAFSRSVRNRYGRFNQGWEHVPLEEFPKEFRVHLLLLGVA